MDFLRFLQGIRNPILDAILSVITYAGDEIFFMAIAITVFWCISKKHGYYILVVGFFGTVLNQFMKLTFRIPRPWVQDPTFTIVESAREAATGYSFPSGHTQNAVGTMTCVYLSTKKTWIRIVSVALIILVPFSRMYLGVHTPLDVGVAFAMAVLIAAALRPMVRHTDNNPRILTVILLVMLLVCLLYWTFINCHTFPADIDSHNLHSGTKNAYTLLGCLLGLLAAKAVDERYIHFEVSAVWWAQIIKTAVGLGICIAIKSGLKPVLLAFLPEHPATAIRYGIMVFFAGAIWPMTFRWFAGLGQKNKG